MQEELKEAFRMYDREGNGYITTSTLKEILAALDDKLNSSDLDGKLFFFAFIRIFLKNNVLKAVEIIVNFLIVILVIH